ncbi:hypothetical protein BO99DRAFT_148629 [Aspergillus violaceofuscus CBS 115571]|uniref:Uncharacterized protein n=1 Tax=Aspergillus violaceofuscus (strain CBS 115571) TaxID=1450538 RepID=A0A2V5H4Z0_ASPV1|nr:hypothetical protein BO99DRAFT_148629 [Aspergillus violaceofuscus CBS 115571]
MSLTPLLFPELHPPPPLNQPAVRLQRAYHSMSSIIVASAGRVWIFLQSVKYSWRPLIQSTMLERRHPKTGSLSDPANSDMPPLDRNACIAGGGQLTLLFRLTYGSFASLLHLFCASSVAMMTSSPSPPSPFPRKQRKRKEGENKTKTRKRKQRSWL